MADVLSFSYSQIFDSDYFQNIWIVINDHFQNGQVLIMITFKMADIKN